MESHVLAAGARNLNSGAGVAPRAVPGAVRTRGAVQVSVPMVCPVVRVRHREVALTVPAAAPELQCKQ